MTKSAPSYKTWPIEQTTLSRKRLSETMLAGIRSMLGRVSLSATEEEEEGQEGVEDTTDPLAGPPYRPFTVGSILVSRGPMGGRLGPADDDNDFLSAEALRAGPSHLIFLEPSTFMSCDCTAMCSHGCFHSVGTEADLRHAMQFHRRARTTPGYTFTVLVAPQHWLEDAAVLAFSCLSAEQGLGTALDEMKRITGHELSPVFVRRCHERLAPR